MTTDMQAELKRIASELRAYNPAADEYKGEHIHKVWAREIEAALASCLDAQPSRSETASRILSAIHDVAELTPEDDETWESWYAAAFDLLASRVGELLGARPDAQADEARAADPGEELQGWSVTVERNGVCLLTIENECVGGVDNIDDFAPLVRNCAEHLLSFIGRDTRADERGAFE